MMDKPNIALDAFDEPLPDMAEGQLSIDVFETDQDIIVQSAIAGVSADELDLYVNKDMVTIRGERQRDKRMQAATLHYEECFWGAFSRTIVLPSHVNPAAAEAEIKDGVLTITLPKEASDAVAVDISHSS